MVQNNKPLNAFTVDLEEWFQGLTSTNALVKRWPALESRVVQATQQVLALLREHRIQATFFVLGYVADRHPRLIEQIAAEGHELGVHGYLHRFVSRMTAAEFKQELDEALEAIFRVTGKAPAGHRAPYFSINAQTPWAFEVLESRGFRYDSSVFPVRSLLYGYPGAPRFPYRVPGTSLIEFPASTVRFAGRNWPWAGGFYNRVLPLTLTRWGMRQINAAGQPVVLYVHPWELDTGQRYKRVTPRERVTHYAGRRGLARKLHALLSAFPFGPLEQMLREPHENVAAKPGAFALIEQGQ